MDPGLGPSFPDSDLSKSPGPRRIGLGLYNIWLVILAIFNFRQTQPVIDLQMTECAWGKVNLSALDEGEVWDLLGEAKTEQSQLPVMSQSIIFIPVHMFLQNLLHLPSSSPNLCESQQQYFLPR